MSEKYADLEKKHGLVDVMEKEEYKWQALHMKGALEQLIDYRGQVPGGDLAPGWDEVRLWPVIVDVYTLLEQCLKLLVAVRVKGYLDRIKTLKGKEERSQAEKDGHDLVTVFDRLEKLDKGILEREYKRYASFLKFDREVPDLRGYFAKVGEGQIAWRYFLIEKDLASMKDLPRPLSPDMFLELARCVIDILHAKTWGDHGLRHVCVRLENSMRAALNHPTPVPAGQGEAVSKDRIGWLKQAGGTINAISRWVRAGVLDVACKEDLRKWLDDSLMLLRKNAEQERGIDLRLFMRMAKECCLTTDGNRFEFRNERPKPIDGVDGLVVSLMREFKKGSGFILGGWRIKWEGESGSSWEGHVVNPWIDEHPWGWGVPVRAGQTFLAQFEEDASPSLVDIPMDEKGELSLLRKGRVVASMQAVLMLEGIHLNYHSFTNFQDAYMGSIVKPGDDPYGSFEVPDDENRYYYRGHFMRVDDSSDWEQLKMVRGHDCPSCKGTGFCKDCLGESASDDDCGSCVDARGLCPECKGYGKNGHHLVAESFNKEAESLR